MATAVHLETVTEPTGARENIQQYGRDAGSWIERATSLIKQTTYWVFEPEACAFGPAKFIGFKNMTLARYDAAHRGECTGARFDGTVTRAALEGVVGPFAVDEALTGRLFDWIGDTFDEAVLSGVDRSKWQFTRLQPERRYWAFACNPDRFDGLGAVSALDEIVWTTNRGDIHVGDRLILWQGKGSTGRRGVIALGEVLEAPIERAGLDVERQYWRQEFPEIERRTLFRVIRPEGFPVWEDDESHALLSSLAVARATGGTVFTLEPEQWHDILELADSEPTFTEQVRAARSGGQGFNLSPAQRKAVELHAMARAEAYFVEQGYGVRDVSGNRPFDLLCKKPDAEVRVEVKGTTTGGESVILTYNEVEHAHEHADGVALFVVSGIRLDAGEGRPSASGGEQLILWPWDVDRGTLKPIQYEYRPEPGGA